MGTGDPLRLNHRSVGESDSGVCVSFLIPFPNVPSHQSQKAASAYLWDRARLGSFHFGWIEMFLSPLEQRAIYHNIGCLRAQNISFLAPS